MKRPILLLLWGLIFAFLGGCGGTLPIDNKQAEQILRNYIISPGDMLLIDIMEEETISRTVPVRPDGKISLPLINDIQAAGLTAMELRKNLIKKLSKFYKIVDVTVTVTEVKGYKVNIIGNVNRPGVKILTAKTTFLEAISLGEGFSEWADVDDIYIIRQINGKRRKIKVDYEGILEGKKEDIWILPGDTIVVP